MKVVNVDALVKSSSGDVLQVFDRVREMSNRLTPREHAEDCPKRVTKGFADCNWPFSVCVPDDFVAG